MSARHLVNQLARLPALWEIKAARIQTDSQKVTLIGVSQGVGVPYSQVDCRGLTTVKSNL